MLRKQNRSNCKERSGVTGRVHDVQLIEAGGAKYIGITHTGLTRELNEDRYLIKDMPDQSVLIAVADGLGGDVSGDFAAEKIR